MLSPLFTRIGELFSGRWLVPGVLPALVVLGYGALLTSLITGQPMPDVWSESPTWATVTAILSLAVLTFLFDALKGPMLRWLSGSPWLVPRSRAEAHARRLRELDARGDLLIAVRLEFRSRRDRWKKELDAAVARCPPNPVWRSDLEARLAVIERRARLTVPRADLAVAEVGALVDELLDVLRGRAVSGARAAQACFTVSRLFEYVDKWLGVEVGQHQRARLTRYPNPVAVYPTLLGTHVWEIDYGCSSRYGMDLAAFWARLRFVVDEASWKHLESAKAALEFVVACVWIHIGLAGAVVLLFPTLYRSGFGITGIVLAAVGVGVATLGYGAALEAARGFSADLEASAEVHRTKLLTVLGTSAEADPEEESRTWDRLSAARLPDSGRAP